MAEFVNTAIVASMGRLFRAVPARVIDKTRAAANVSGGATRPCLSRPEASAVLSKLGFWHTFCLRREALLVRVEVEDLHQPAVAAVGLKLRAA
ncbi:hypothetical protein [Streptomyces sp. NBC_01594]|uniref:hypothetical protein n=1 Tax=Streptomyces sp. NBC_01594 TaxID=2975890 RepID=UPI0038671B3B